MPAYDYVCDTCNSSVEVTHGIFEEKNVLCEKCLKKMRKVISGGTGTLFRGQGWVSKGSGTTTPQYSKEVGIRVNQGMEDVVSEEVRKKAIKK